MSNQTLNFSLKSDSSVLPDGEPSERILEISVTAPASQARPERAPLNLALVIDRSGSMQGPKLEYVRQAADFVVNHLAETDRVALVAFDDQVVVHSPSVPVTAENRARLSTAIRSLRTGGSTNLGDGWLVGCQQIAQTMTAGQLVRTLLLTDGEANVGIIEPDELARHASELFARGVSTSTFGVGTGFNEHLLEAMSNQGGGNFHFIEGPAMIPQLFEGELKDLLEVTARAVEITLELPERVSAKLLGGWRNDSVPGRMRIFLGDLPAGQTREVYLKLLLPHASGKTNLKVQAQALARDTSDQVMDEKATLEFRYAPAAEAHAAPRDLELLGRFAQVYIADVTTRSLKLERNGDREMARQELEMALSEYGQHLVGEKGNYYRHLAERMKRGLEEYDRKVVHAAMYVDKQRRGPRDS